MAKEDWDNVFEVEELCRTIRRNNMKGLNKFKTEIKAEVDKVKDNDKKKLIKAEADEIIKHIEDVCDEEYDNLLAQDHKSFKRMWSFIMKNARQYAIENCAMVRSDIVFGWIDEYVGLDDKAEVEKENAEKKTANAKIEEILAKSKGTKTEEPKAEEPTQASIFDLF